MNYTSNYVGSELFKGKILFNIAFPLVLLTKLLHWANLAGRYPVLFVCHKKLWRQNVAKSVALTIKTIQERLHRCVFAIYSCHTVWYIPNIENIMSYSFPAICCSGTPKISLIKTITAQKVKYSINDFFSKCDQICSFLQIWSYLLNQYLMANFIFCAGYPIYIESQVTVGSHHK